MIQKDSRLKVAILDHSPDLGGAEVAVLTFLRNIDRSRFDVTVILPSEGTFSKVLGASGIPVSIVHLPMGLVRLKRGKAFQSLLLLLTSLFSLQFFILNLCIYLKKNRFQLVLTNTIKSHLYGSVAARLCSIPLVWRFHDILSPSDFSPFLIKCIALFGRLFPKKILAVSKVTRDHLAQNGIDRGKIDVIFNSVDHERFETKGDFKTLRDEYQLGNGAKLVGCIGRIIPQKGQKVLLSAVPGVLQRYPEAFFLIVGDVFLKEEAYKKELLEIMKKNGIEKNTKLTGFRTDIWNVIRALDLVIFPSIAPEAFPLSVLEAMSLGKAVIASDIGGVKEIIEDGVTGVLVEPNQPEQITERILCLFNDPRICDGIGQRAKEFVKTKFSLKDYVLNMEGACLNAALREERFEDRHHP
jgi:glycosyltransferase involved in cell wall biosynthesis